MRVKISSAKAEFELDKAGFRFSIDAGVLDENEYAYDKGNLRIMYRKNSSKKAVSVRVFKLKLALEDGYSRLIKDDFPLIEKTNILNAIKHATEAQGGVKVKASELEIENATQQYRSIKK